VSAHAVPLRTVRVATLLGQADSGAQPVKALTTTDEFYWCKMSNNPQGLETVVFEVIVTVIGQALGAPIPNGALVELPEPIADFFYRDGTRISTSGFGSQLVPGVIESDQVQHERKDGNPERLPRLFALCELCMACDFQIMYEDRAEHRAYGFDFGYWLDNDEPGWTLDAVYKGRDRRYTASTWTGIQFRADALLDARNSVENLAERDIAVAIASVPDEWAAEMGGLSGVAEEIWRRKNCTLDAIDEKLKEGRFA